MSLVSGNGARSRRDPMHGPDDDPTGAADSALAQLHGAGFDWLAADASGQVAVFSSLAALPPPEAVFRGIDAHRRALEAILRSPRCSRSLLPPSTLPEKKFLWRALADRGLYVYASYRAGAPYWMADAPETPVHVFDLPAFAAGLLGAARPLALRFRHLSSVTAAVLGPG